MTLNFLISLSPCAPWGSGGTPPPLRFGMAVPPGLVLSSAESSSTAVGVAHERGEFVARGGRWEVGGGL